MTQQLAIDFSAPRARARDPSTSHAAAARVSRFSSGHFAKIRAALELGPGTYTEISQRCGLEQHAVARRLPELQDAGICRPSGEEREGKRVWELVRGA